MGEIELAGKHARGRVVLMDDPDLPLVEPLRWRVLERVRPNGTRSGPYAVATLPTGHRGGRNVLMHVLITGYARTDHWNGNGLDNRRFNLRDATQGQNMANRAGNRISTSPFKGVSLHPASGLWMARIKADGRTHYLGYFHDDADAARAYDARAAELFGGFARLNFPA